MTEKSNHIHLNNQIDNEIDVKQKNQNDNNDDNNRLDVNENVSNNGHIDTPIKASSSSSITSSIISSSLSSSRAKLYKLSADGGWNDLGTGFVVCSTRAAVERECKMNSYNNNNNQIDNDDNEIVSNDDRDHIPALIIVAEIPNNNSSSSSSNDTSSLPLQSKPSSNINSTTSSIIFESPIVYTVFERQGESIIMWRDADEVKGETEYALSFQRPTNCDEIWSDIASIQANFLHQHHPHLNISSINSINSINSNNETHYMQLSQVSRIQMSNDEHVYHLNGNHNTTTSNSNSNTIHNSDHLLYMQMRNNANTSDMNSDELMMLMSPDSNPNPSSGISMHNSNIARSLMNLPPLSKENLPTIHEVLRHTLSSMGGAVFVSNFIVRDDCRFIDDMEKLFDLLETDNNNNDDNDNNDNDDVEGFYLKSIPEIEKEMDTNNNNNNNNEFDNDNDDNDSTNGTINTKNKSHSSSQSQSQTQSQFSSQNTPSTIPGGDLGVLANVGRMIVTLNDSRIIETLLTDTHFLRFIGIMEYDPGLRQNGSYREFFSKHPGPKTVIALPTRLECEIKLCFRLKFLKDFIIRPLIDDDCASNVTQMLSFTVDSICRNVFLQMPQILDDLFDLLLDEILPHIIPTTSNSSSNSSSNNNGHDTSSTSVVGVGAATNAPLITKTTSTSVTTAVAEAGTEKKKDKVIPSSSSSSSIGNSGVMEHTQATPSLPLSQPVSQTQSLSQSMEPYTQPLSQTSQHSLHVPSSSTSSSSSTSISIPLTTQMVSNELDDPNADADAAEIEVGVLTSGNIGSHPSITPSSSSSSPSTPELSQTVTDAIAFLNELFVMSRQCDALQREAMYHTFFQRHGAAYTVVVDFLLQYQQCQCQSHGLVNCNNNNKDKSGDSSNDSSSGRSSKKLSVRFLAVDTLLVICNMLSARMTAALTASVTSLATRLWASCSVKSKKEEGKDTGTVLNVNVMNPVKVVENVDESQQHETITTTTTTIPSSSLSSSSSSSCSDMHEYSRDGFVWQQTRPLDTTTTTTTTSSSSSNEDKGTDNSDINDSLLGTIMSLIGCEQEAAVLEHMRDILKLFIELDRSLHPFGANGSCGGGSDGDTDGIHSSTFEEDEEKEMSNSYGNSNGWLSRENSHGGTTLPVTTTTTTTTSTTDCHEIQEQGQHGQILSVEEMFVTFSKSFATVLFDFHIKKLLCVYQHICSSTTSTTTTTTDGSTSTDDNDEEDICDRICTMTGQSSAMAIASHRVVCEVLVLLIAHHSYRMKYFFMSHNVLHCLCSVLSSRHKLFRLGPLKVVKTLIASHNEQIDRRIVRLDGLRPILQLLEVEDDVYHNTIATTSSPTTSTLGSSSKKKQKKSTNKDEYEDNQEIPTKIKTGSGSSSSKRLRSRTMTESIIYELLLIAADHGTSDIVIYIWENLGQYVKLVTSELVEKLETSYLSHTNSNSNSNSNTTITDVSTQGSGPYTNAYADIYSAMGGSMGGYGSFMSTQNQLNMTSTATLDSGQVMDDSYNYERSSSSSSSSSSSAKPEDDQENVGMTTSGQDKDICRWRRRQMQMQEEEYFDSYNDDEGHVTYEGVESDSELKDSQGEKERRGLNVSRSPLRSITSPSSPSSPSSLAMTIALQTVPLSPGATSPVGSVGNVCSNLKTDLDVMDGISLPPSSSSSLSPTSTDVVTNLGLGLGPLRSKDSLRCDEDDEDIGNPKPNSNSNTNPFIQIQIPTSNSTSSSTSSSTSNNSSNSTSSSTSSGKIVARAVCSLKRRIGQQEQELEQEPVEPVGVEEGACEDIDRANSQGKDHTHVNTDVVSEEEEKNATSSGTNGSSSSSSGTDGSSNRIAFSLTNKKLKK